jgi:hypothetical protein
MKKRQRKKRIKKRVRALWLVHTERALALREHLLAQI